MSELEDRREAIAQERFGRPFNMLSAFTQHGITARALSEQGPGYVATVENEEGPKLRLATVEREAASLRAEVEDLRETVNELQLELARVQSQWNPQQ